MNDANCSIYIIVKDLRLVLAEPQRTNICIRCSLSTLYKDYVVAICQGKSWFEKVSHGSWPLDIFAYAQVWLHMISTCIQLRGLLQNTYLGKRFLVKLPNRVNIKRTENPTRCGHTLIAVVPTKSHGPHLILFGGAIAIEGGTSSANPGIRIIFPFLTCCVISSNICNNDDCLLNFYFRISRGDRLCSFVWCSC